MKNLVLAAFGLALAASSALASTPRAPAQTALGTVVDANGLDGCTFLVKLDDGQTLEANLPEAFQVDGLKVKITYVSDPRPSICMAGETVDVVSIEKASTLRAAHRTQLVGHFDNIACAGSCPGFSFTTATGQVWVDVASVQATGISTSQPGDWLLKGRFENRRVFSESQGYVLMKLFVVTSAQRVYTAL